MERYYKLYRNEPVERGQFLTSQKSPRLLKNFSPKLISKKEGVVMVSFLFSACFWVEKWGQTSYARERPVDPFIRFLYRPWQG
jgi:hypothetical protein